MPRLTLVDAWGLCVLCLNNEGASTTLINKDLADQLGIIGTKNEFTLDWTAGITRVEQESRQVNLSISAKGEHQKFSLNTVQTVGDLSLPLQSLDSREAKQLIPILRGLPIASYEKQRPGLLIGLNNIHLIAPVQSRIDESGELIAVRSKLGWRSTGRHLKLLEL